MSRVKVLIPTVLADSTGGQRVVQLDASTIEEALRRLVEQFGDAFAERVLDPSGAPRRFLNFYVNGRNTRLLQQFQTPLNEGDEIHILPAVSGG
ncbi:MAG: MoaD family protein [Candidatus Bathyarchaeia archaeon]